MAASPRRAIGTLDQLFSIARQLRLSRTLLWLGVPALCLDGATLLLYPQGVRHLIDALNSSRPAHIDSLALSLGAVFVVQALASGLRHYLWGHAGAQILMQLRRELFDRVLQRPITFFDQRSVGDLQSRLDRDVYLVQSALTQDIPGLLWFSLLCIGSGALLAYTSLPLAAMIVVVLPPAWLAARRLGQWLSLTSRQQQKLLADTTDVARDALNGIHTIKAFGHEQRESAHYTHALSRILALARQHCRRLAIFQSGAGLALYGSLVVVLWWGARLVREDALSTGALTAFLLYTMTASHALTGWLAAWSRLMRSTGAAERVADIIAIAAPHPLSTSTMADGTRFDVRFERVGFTYDTGIAPVLDDINLTFRSGALTAVVGPSGSGKTTLAHLACGFYPPTSGQIWWGQNNLATLSPSARQRHIAYVGQPPHLFQRTVMENLCYGRQASPDDVRALCRDLALDGVIENLPKGYDTVLGRGHALLSSGQQQRLVLARALLAQRPLLVLDESTSQLDEATEALALSAITRWAQDSAVVWITHRTRYLDRADVVIRMSAGAIYAAA